MTVDPTYRGGGGVQGVGGDGFGYRIKQGDVLDQLYDELKCRQVLRIKSRDHDIPE